MLRKFFKKWQLEVREDVKHYSRLQLLSALAPEAGKKAVKKKAAEGTKKQSQVTKMKIKTALSRALKKKLSKTKACKAVEAAKKSVSGRKSEDKAKAVKAEAEEKPSGEAEVAEAEEKKSGEAELVEVLECNARQDKQVLQAFP